ncbi:MAG: hypothetical protein AB3N16_07875 [Flavobacteriaceae bacterium]
MGIGDRMQEIVEELGGNNKRFEESLGVKSGYITKLIKQNSYPSSKVIAGILENYPQYNIEWVLTGKGERKKSSSDILMEESISYGKSNTIDALIDQKISNGLDSRLGNITEVIKELIADQIDEEIKKTRATIRAKENGTH